MLKIIDNIDLKELEKYGWKTFYVKTNKKQILYAVKDIFVNYNWYRIGVNEIDRKFTKSKFRIGKFLLDVKVTKKDIEDLIKANLVEKVGE